MTDRIDQMTHDELKAATRKLLDSTFGLRHVPGIAAVQDLFAVSTLDKVRELLKAEGWVPALIGVGIRDNEPFIDVHQRSSVAPERWIENRQ